MTLSFNESTIEGAALEWLGELGYRVLHGLEIAPGAEASERDSYEQVVLTGRLRDAIVRLNPDLPPAVHDQALRQVLRRESADVLPENRRLHRMLVDGLTIPYQEPGGPITYPRLRLIDFEQPGNNDFLAVNQFTVAHAGRHRRPDIVLFVNGLPLVVFELKDPDADEPTLDAAYRQLCTYEQEIPELFIYNALLVISQGFDARLGVLTAPFERFAPWRTIDGEEVAPAGLPGLEVLLKGAFAPARLLQLLRSFIVFEADGPKLSKKVAAYHQFHAVTKAVEKTVAAASAQGDRRAGVVWHTQGSGKSLTMVFYTGLLVQHPALANPTIVVITDRNDLDDQLFGTFAGCAELLRQEPKQAESREELKTLLSVAAGGIVFTTVQKFLPGKGSAFPLLTARRNVIVIADEAHRSQYGFIDGFARRLREALPGATFIGFTGTPVDLSDRITTAVFGDYIDVYDIQRAVEDGATVKIFYESRLAKLSLSEKEKPRLDAQFEELTEQEEESQREKLKAKWAALEAIVGAQDRIALVARDLVEHFERRCEALDGKAMVVCMSRRICVELYDAIAALRPDWVSEDDTSGAMKVVMTGSAADGPAWQQHIRAKLGREQMAERFKDPEDPLRLVIVRDLWLTGFDVPCLHTLYVDKPMRGHGLMQAIARVNRVFRDKPGGLVVDYIGLADQLQEALATYVQSGGKGNAAIDQDAAVRALLEQHDIVAALFHGFDWSSLKDASDTQKLQLLTAAQEHILAQQDGKQRFLTAFAALSKAFALAVPDERALALRDDIAFFQWVRNALADPSTPSGQRPQALDQAIRQLVSKAITPEGVVDIFSAAGLPKPDISVLSDSFLAEVQRLPQKNLAVEMLRKLLNNEVRARAAKNVVQSRLFSEKLTAALRSYENRSIETAKVIEELIALAQELREAQRRGERLHLDESEVAFYDGLAVHGDVASVMGDAVLAEIARQLASDLRRNATVDWRIKESARAKMRTLVRRILRSYGYPPDQQEAAVITVLQQAELFADELAA